MAPDLQILTRRSTSSSLHGRESLTSFGLKSSASSRSRSSTSSSLSSGSVYFDEGRLLHPALLGNVTQTFLNHKINHSGKIFKKNLKDYRVVGIEPFSIQQYIFHTVYEKRYTRTVQNPYRKETDCFEKTSTPSESIWKMKIPISKSYNAKNVKIPGTSTIKICSKCCGKGTTKCERCEGNGNHRCFQCHGEGHHTASHITKSYNNQTEETETHHHYNRETCHYCHGHGHAICDYCHGKKTEACSKCKQTGKVEEFTEIVAEWTSRQDSLSAGPLRLPEEYLLQCSGTPILSEEGDYKSPLQSITFDECPNKKLVLASQRFMDSHEIFKPNWAIRKQFQFLRDVPVYHVIYELQGKLKEAWMAGNDPKFFNPKKFKSVIA